MRSTGRGSRPKTSGARSSTTPAKPRGDPCESVTSAQPTRPSSVVALTKIHGRQPASQNSVSSRMTFITRRGYEVRRFESLDSDSSRGRLRIFGEPEDEAGDIASLRVDRAVWRVLFRQ